MQTSRLTLVFDGDCAFCTACATLLRWLDRNHRVHVAPFQAPGVCQSLGLPFEECEKAAWALGGDGRLARGAEAILLSLSVATGAAALASLYRRPRLRRGADAVYRWVARHRGLFPGVRPYCESHPTECGRRA